MAKSLETRLNPQEQEVIEYTRLHGQFKAMDRFEVRDYCAFINWLERHTGQVDWGLTPLLDGKSHSGNLGVDLLDAFLHKLRIVEAEKAKLSARLAEVQAQLETYQCNSARDLEPRISEVMRICAPERRRLASG